MSKPSVFVSGMGCVGPAGLNPEVFWNNTLNEKSIIEKGLGLLSLDSIQELRSTANQSSTSVIDSAYKEKPLLMSVNAANQALHQAGWTGLTQEDGLLFATTTGHVSSWDKDLSSFLTNKVSEDDFFASFKNERLGVMLDQLSNYYSFRGPRQLVSTACAAGTHALALAALWIRSGKVKRCLVGATEVLSTLTIEGFRCFQLLSPHTATPFNVGRPGINLAEGSAFFCLESQSAKPLAQISGVGFSSDAHHMTAPHPEGRGSYQAMQSALQDAGLKPDAISWVHAHGTGSLHNDLSEGIALKTLFAADTPPVSSTKGIHGHTLAASGALETILCVKALEQQMLLRTFGLTEPDPEIQVLHPMRSFKTPLRHILKNTLGFGGSNGALVLSLPEQGQ